MIEPITEGITRLNTHIASEAEIMPTSLLLKTERNATLNALLTAGSANVKMGSKAITKYIIPTP